MRRLRATVLGLLLAGGLFGGTAAAQEFLWGRQFDAADYTAAHAVTTDPAGNVIVAGSAYELQTDAWMAKYTGDGKRLWQRRIGTRKQDYAFALVTDGVGNIFLTGTTSGRLAGDNSDSGDVWVAKYAGDGTQLWVRQFGARKRQPTDSPPHDVAQGIAVDTAGSLFVAGVTTGVFQPAHLGEPDLFLVKLDADGNQVWARQLGETVNRGYGYDVAVDAAAGIFVGGRVRPADYRTSGVGYRGVLLRFDHDGDLVWELRLGKQYTVVDAVVTDDAGRVIVAGYTESFAGIRNSAFVARYDVAGTLLAARRIGPAGARLTLGGLARDTQGRLFAAGSFDRKGWIAELGPTLAPVWSKTLIALDPDHRGYSVTTRAIAAGGSGRVFAAGIVFGPLFKRPGGDVDDGWVAAWRTSQQ